MDFSSYGSGGQKSTRRIRLLPLLQVWLSQKHSVSQAAFPSGGCGMDLLPCLLRWLAEFSCSQLAVGWGLAQSGGHHIPWLMAPSKSALVGRTFLTVQSSPASLLPHLTLCLPLLLGRAPQIIQVIL